MKEAFFILSSCAMRIQIMDNATEDDINAVLDIALREDCQVVSKDDFMTFAKKKLSSCYVDNNKRLQRKVEYYSLHK